MARRGLRVWGFTCVIATFVALFASQSNAANVDERGEMTLGLRTYVNARIGTQNTNADYDFVNVGGPGTDTVTKKSRTFPYSPAGHLRQNRFFLEAEWKHDLKRLQKEGFGPLGLLNQLPFRVRNLRYGLTLRAEGDGLYDWGPSEFRTAEQWVPCATEPYSYRSDRFVRGCYTRNTALNTLPRVGELRRRLRRHGVHRERLFQAYVEADFGNRLWIRAGRQILSWGETDAFRLIDNINPVDSSFGGFLVSLDERRVPLDMIRAIYRTGSIGPMYDTYIEAYAAIDNKVGYDPGTATGSPWGLPNTPPSANTQSVRVAPGRNLNDIRGGARFMFNIGDGTFSIAHYYTYMDLPQVQTFVRPNFFRKDLLDIQRDQAGNPILDENGNQIAGDDTAFDGHFSVRAIQRSELTQITGATMTFALPDLYSIMRAEVAYFKDEARYTQSQLDPFIYHYFGRYTRLAQPNEEGHVFVQDPNAEYQLLPPSVLTRACEAKKGRPGNVDPALCRTTGGKRSGDAIKLAVGWDTNQFIRFLNPHQSFFITTQFFYQRLLGAADRVKLPKQVVGRDANGNEILADTRLPRDGEVLPVTQFDTHVLSGGFETLGAVEPRFIHQPTDTFLHTLLITTSYRSGTVVPSFTFFYDWGGAYVIVPAISFIQDPFRFSVDYSHLAGDTLKGGSGVSLVNDRDTVQFRFEYVI